MKESGMSLCKYLFFQFEIIIYALICSSAKNLYVYCQYYIHMVTNLSTNYKYVIETYICISSLGDDVLFDPNQCIYMLNKILLKLSLGDSND